MQAMLSAGKQGVDKPLWWDKYIRNASDDSEEPVYMTSGQLRGLKRTK